MQEGAVQVAETSKRGSRVKLLKSILCSLFESVHLDLDHQQQELLTLSTGIIFASRTAAAGAFFSPTYNVHFPPHIFSRTESFLP